jgi:hypothetical protein
MLAMAVATAEALKAARPRNVMAGARIARCLTNGDRYETAQGRVGSVNVGDGPADRAFCAWTLDAAHTGRGVTARLGGGLSHLGVARA